MVGSGSAASKPVVEVAARRGGPAGPLPRRALLLGLLASPALAACGLAPAYGPGGSGDRLRGQVAVDTPETPDGFVLGARLEDRLGRAPDGADLRLVAELSAEAVSAAVTPGGAITRYDLVGRSPWRLEGPGGTVLAQGEATAFTGYSATGTTVATTAAEADARVRLIMLLADSVVTRLLVLPPSILPGPAAPGARP